MAVRWPEGLPVLKSATDERNAVMVPLVGIAGTSVREVPRITLHMIACSLAQTASMSCQANSP